MIDIQVTPKTAYDRQLDALERQSFDDDGDDGLAPIFFLARRLGVDKQGFVGFGGTAFFSAYGAGLFGGWQFNENLDIGGFAGAVTDYAGSPAGDDEYRSVDDGDAVVQFGITYLF